MSVVSLESATRSEPSPKAGWKPTPPPQDAPRQVVTLESASRSAPSPKAGWKPREAASEEAAADTSKKEEKKEIEDVSHEEKAVGQKTAAADTSEKEEKKDRKDKSHEEDAVGQKTAVAADTSKEEEKDRKDVSHEDMKAFVVHEVNFRAWKSCCGQACGRSQPLPSVASMPGSFEEQTLAACKDLERQGSNPDLLKACSCERACS